MPRNGIRYSRDDSGKSDILIVGWHIYFNLKFFSKKFQPVTLHMLLGIFELIEHKLTPIFGKGTY